MASTPPKLKIGTEARLRGRPVVVTCLTPTSYVMVADVHAGHRYKVQASELTIPLQIDGQEFLVPPPPPSKTAENAVGDDGRGIPEDPFDAFFDCPYVVEGDDIDLAAIDQKDWDVAEARKAVLAPLLDRDDLTKQDVADVARRAGCGVSTVYNWLRAFKGSNDLASLLPERPGPKKGHSRLSPEQDLIIRECAKKYLQRSRLPVSDIYDDIKTVCDQNDVPIPARTSLKRRLDRLPRAETLRARGQGAEADKVFAPALRKKQAGAPMEILQIDHTEADIELVEETTREPIGRPWVTLAIDVYSRQCAGFYVSYDRPNAGSVGLAIRNALFEKAAYLEELGVPGEHLIHGPAGIIHADNAREFRGEVIKRGCARHGIDLRWRPVADPKYGGHIERLMGELAHMSARLPGKTLSNTVVRKGLKPSEEAAMTLREFESYLVDYFVNKYAHEKHSRLGVAPAVMMHRGLAPMVPYAEERKRLLTIDLMPFKERTIQTYGIMIGNLTYYDPVLDPYIRDAQSRHGRKDKKHIIRYDPRDISKVLFYDELAGKHYAIPIAEPTAPSAFSRWEALVTQRDMETRGESTKDQRAFFETLRRLRQRVEDSETRTRDARAMRRHRENIRSAERAATEIQVLADAPKLQRLPAPTLPSRDWRTKADPFADFGDD